MAFSGWAIGNVAGATSGQIKIGTTVVANLLPSGDFLLLYPAGTYTLKAVAGGITTTKTGVVIPELTAITCNFNPHNGGTSAWSVPSTPPSPGRVKGYVKERGSYYDPPVNGATVRIRRTSSGEIVWSGVSASNGAYNAGYTLPTGVNLQVEARHPTDSDVWQYSDVFSLSSGQSKDRDLIMYDHNNNN